MQPHNISALPAHRPLSWAPSAIKHAARWLPLLAALGIIHPAPADERTPLIRYEATAPIMGCTFGIAAYGPDRDTLARQVESAFEQARAIDRWLSNYQADSELSQLNRRAAESPVPVSQELFDLLANAARYSRATNGAFDMTVGPLVRAWGFYDGDGKLPNAQDLAQARKATGYQLVELDSARTTVHFARPGVELDPGGIGKGYAVDRMIDMLRRAGVTSALVNACHSSIYALGTPPDNASGWRIEIDSPSSGPPVEILLKDQSLATSGSQEKFFEAEGRIYSHIIDPRTGRPAEGLLAVSVVAPTALESEIWSTAIFVNGPDAANSNTPRELDVFACPTVAACRWIRRPR